MIILTDPYQSYYFKQNMANARMQDAYYLETILKGTGSIIIIANDESRDTTSYLLSVLLEILSVAVRWVSKTGIIISKTALCF